LKKRQISLEEKRCHTRVLAKLKYSILTFCCIRSQRINSEKGCYRWQWHFTFFYLFL